MSEPTWSKSKITVDVLIASTGKVGSREIDADIFCGLAVHDALGMATTDNKPLISITHAATGKKVSPTYFDDRGAAFNAAKALAALPVLWDQHQPLTPENRPFLRAAVEAVCALCGAFEVDSAMDRPGGHA